MNIREQLELHEGKRNLPYEDDRGNLTIGIGHNMDKPLSEAAIQQIFQDDLREAERELDRVLPNWTDLDTPRQNVVIDMMFNLGAPRFLTFKKFIKALSVHDYDTAADEMLDSRWFEQVGQRATRLAEMMRGEA